MAIQVIFYVLVARKFEIDDKYPGGLDQFRIELGAGSLEDEHLLAYSDMGSYPREKVIRALQRNDIDVFRTYSPEWIQESVDWLECQKIGNSYFIWLRGSDPGGLEFFIEEEWRPNLRVDAPKPGRKWWQFR